MKQYIAFYTDHHSSDVGRKEGGSLSRSRYPHHCTLLCCLPNTRQRKKLFSSRYFDLCFLLSFSEIVPHTSQHLHNSHYTWHSRHRPPGRTRWSAAAHNWENFTFPRVLEFDGYIFVEHNYPSRVLQHFSSDRLCAGKQSDASGQADNIDTAFGNYFYFCRPIIAAGARTLQQVGSRGQE